MTALGRYAKLEAVARYVDGASSEAREVVLSFGERSLVIVGLDDRPIAHWPLASLRALGSAAQRPLELVPDPASDERLLLDDREMSAAIAHICPGLHPPTATRHKRRGRATLWAAAALAAGAVVAGAVLLVPPLLPDRLIELVPPEREEALGGAVAARIPAMLGPADRPVPELCVAEEGAAALLALSARLAPAIGLPFPLRVAVLDHPGVDALTLPGGRVVILRGLLEAAHSPEEVAAVLAHAAGHARHRDPLSDTLDRSGAAAVRILMGEVTGGAAVAAARAALDPVSTPEAEALADAEAFAILSAVGLPSRPLSELPARLVGAYGADPPRYVAAHPWSPGRAGRAAAADAIGNAAFRPALSDRDWIALGNICDRTARPGRLP